MSFVAAVLQMSQGRAEVLPSDRAQSSVGSWFFDMTEEEAQTDANGFIKKQNQS